MGILFRFMTTADTIFLIVKAPTVEERTHIWRLETLQSRYGMVWSVDWLPGGYSDRV